MIIKCSACGWNPKKEHFYKCTVTQDSIGCPECGAFNVILPEDETKIRPDTTVMWEESEGSTIEPPGIKAGNQSKMQCNSIRMYTQGEGCTHFEEKK